MEETVQVALIVGGASMLTQIFIAVFSTIRNEKVTDLRFSVIDTRLFTIEEKLEKHNKFAERLTVVEQTDLHLCADVIEIKKDRKECKANCPALKGGMTK